MANKNKKSAAEEAAKQTPDNTVVETPDVKVVNPTKITGLSQGEKVAYLTAVQKERDEIRNAGEGNFLKEHVKGLSIIAQAAILDIAAGEIACGTSAMGFIIAKNEESYSALLGMAAAQGIKLPAFKTLPSPTKEQLKSVGLEAIEPNNAVLVKIDNKAVSDDTKKKKTEEGILVSKAVDNPAEIEGEEQLRASLAAMLIKSVKDGIDRPDTRVQRTIKFYRGYLTIQANKIEDAEEKKAALEKVKNSSRIQMLTEISEIVGSCPFAINGVAKFLRNYTNETNSPISAFCLYRRSAVPEGDGTIDDAYLADVVRVIIIWSCNSQIAECQSLIDSNKKLAKNEKGSAKVATETSIRVNEEKIKELQGIINIVTNPSFDVVDNLIANYNSENKESVEYKLAHRIVHNIMGSYYPDVKSEELDENIMLNNVQQRAGIITNLFRDSMTQSIKYNEANLVPMAKKEAEKEEETEKEEPSKN